MKNPYFLASPMHAEMMVLAYLNANSSEFSYFKRAAGSGLMLSTQI